MRCVPSSQCAPACLASVLLLASCCVFTCVRFAACTCICVLLRLFGCLRPVECTCVRFCFLRVHLRPVACALASVKVPCVRTCCLHLHLRPFGSLASLWMLASSCLLVHALASACVGTCVRLPCVLLLVATALVALVGPAQKTNIATNHPPYPFVLLAFYL